jgi:uncharacterized protein YegJ (DUF2314 family)
MNRLALLFCCVAATSCATGGGADKASTTEVAAVAAATPRPEGPCRDVVGSLIPIRGQDNVSAVASDDAEMLAARAHAQETLGHFLSVLAAPEDARTLSVKAPFVEGEIVEHMWIAKPVFDGEVFTGKLDNDPAELTGVIAGQDVRIGRDRITDWMYVRDGLLHGSFTLRVLLSRMERDRCEQILAGFDVAGFGPWEP